MKICVLIPTYNESRMIGQLVSRVKNDQFDVLVIDDGSKDRTAEIAKEKGARVIINERNMGKGASLKAGFNHALQSDYEAVVIMDGDGQHDPIDIRRFINAAKSTGSDLIIGNRMVNAGAMPPIRQATNRWMSNFISKACGQHIPDTQCGFRLIKRKLLKKIRLISSKYETESELLLRAGKERFKISSIPIKSIYNGEVSKIHPFKDTYRFIRLVIKINLEKRKKKA